MLLLKTFVVSLLVATAFAASTFASRAPDNAEALKSDLPIITTAMLPIGMDADPYPASYEVEIAFVSDEEDCDQAEAEDAVAQIEDHKTDYGPRSLQQ